MIKCTNLTKSYGSLTAVNDISFSVNKGSICGFLGMNGAGKTSTIRMLTGVIEPSQGEIFIGEYNLKTNPEEAKRIVGYVPDRPYIYPSMTPIEFLSFMGDLYFVSDRTIIERSESLLRHYGLWDKRNELIQGFSHGMKQRVSTCAALIHNPEVLIIDEPMVGLDPQGAKTFKESLSDYAKEGMCIFLSTHSLHTAEEVCDEIIIIHQGKILTQGSVEEIKSLVKGTTENHNLENVFISLTNEGIHVR